MHDPGAPKPSKERDPWGRPGLAGLIAFLRGLPARLRRPESLLMLMALLASVAAHMPPWVGLGALADYFDRTESERAQNKPVEVSFEVNDTPPEVAPPAQPEQPPEPEKVRPPKKKPAHKVAEKEPLKEAEPEPEKKVAQLELQKPALPEPPPAPSRKQSITQKSQDPNVEPPPNAAYLAEENQRVEEETVAEVTDETKNDPDPQKAAPQAEGPEESGDSLENERGQEKGSKTQEREQVAAAARAQQPPAPTTPSQPPAVAKQAPRKEVAPQPLIVRDPMGTFVIAPSQQAQRGQAGRAGREGASSAAAPNLKVSWNAFEQTYGAEQLAQDRMPKEAKRRGAGREKRWAEFRAAVENYVTGVKPGNQTALNAAADPFAAYLAAFHRNLHTEFVHEFIASLPSSGELADESLVAKVEIVVNPDGTLDRVGVVKSSGNLMYDFGAFNAVQRGAPYPPPPERIRSSDGRTYLRWALHRDQSQCGTWNAEPFILKNPPRSPNDPKPDNVSPYLGPGGEHEHGQRAPKNEPRPGTRPAAVSPGDTLGGLLQRRRLEPA